MSNARLEVLGLINQHNPITLKQLCEIQGVSMPTMSKLVDELQNEALVIRAQSKDDARQRWIVPTQKGVQTYQSAQKMATEFWTAHLSGLSKNDVKQVEDALQKLLKVLSPS
ncbi:MarR family winged helix-turn-helix transcriptional regulator [Aliikangiella marina]|uniref:MarR family winged helix-turn-helix transcriptional regulator n=1 Tax=Aliikangiella marina TaxID=1712262 RepID=UPI00163DCB36|nr:MarR family transcriptional regulator [Aliikangiella marina]